MSSILETLKQEYSNLNNEWRGNSDERRSILNVMNDRIQNSEAAQMSSEYAGFLGAASGYLQPGGAAGGYLAARQAQAGIRDKAALGAMPEYNTMLSDEGKHYSTTLNSVIKRLSDRENQWKPDVKVVGNSMLKFDPNTGQTQELFRDDRNSPIYTRIWEQIYTASLNERMQFPSDDARGAYATQRADAVFARAISKDSRVLGPQTDPVGSAVELPGGPLTNATQTGVPTLVPRPQEPVSGQSWGWRAPQTDAHAQVNGAVQQPSFSGKPVIGQSQIGSQGGSPTPMALSQPSGAPQAPLGSGKKYTGQEVSQRILGLTQEKQALDAAFAKKTISPDVFKKEADRLSASYQNHARYAKEHGLTIDLEPVVRPSAVRPPVVSPTVAGPTAVVPPRILTPQDLAVQKALGADEVAAHSKNKEQMSAFRDANDSFRTMESVLISGKNTSGVLHEKLNKIGGYLTYLDPHSTLAKSASNDVAYTGALMVVVRSDIKALGAGASISNLDLITTQKAVGDLRNTPQGNLKNIGLLKLYNATKSELAQRKVDYFDANSKMQGYKHSNEPTHAIRAFRNPYGKETIMSYNIQSKAEWVSEQTRNNPGKDIPPDVMNREWKRFADDSVSEMFK